MIYIFKGLIQITGFFLFLGWYMKIGEYLCYVGNSPALRAEFCQGCTAPLLKYQISLVSYKPSFHLSFSIISCIFRLSSSTVRRLNAGIERNRSFKQESLPVEEKKRAMWNSAHCSPS